MTRGSGWFLRLRLGRHVLRRRHADDVTRDAASRHTTTNYQLASLFCALLKPATQPGGSHKRLKAFSGSKVRRCLKTVSLQMGRGPVLSIYYRLNCSASDGPASNDSEAFDDAVATMIHSSLFSQSNDSQLEFKFRNDAMEVGDFLLLLPPALNRAKAQHACVLRPPERGGAGCQSLIKTPMTGTPSSTSWAEAPYAVYPMTHVVKFHIIVHQRNSLPKAGKNRWLQRGDSRKNYVTGKFFYIQKRTERAHFLFWPARTNMEGAGSGRGTNIYAHWRLRVRIPLCTCVFFCWLLVLWGASRSARKKASCARPHWRKLRVWGLAAGRLFSRFFSMRVLRFIMLGDCWGQKHGFRPRRTGRAPEWSPKREMPVLASRALATDLFPRFFQARPARKLRLSDPKCSSAATQISPTRLKPPKMAVFVTISPQRVFSRIFDVKLRS